MWKDPVFIAVFVGSSVLFSGLAFGFLHVFSGLPNWASALIAIPSGVSVFLFLLQIHVWSDRS
jgi:hypothetical protein